MQPTHKLVRDRIPDIIRAEGKTPEITEISGAALMDAFNDKLAEECAEFKAAETPAQKLEELADVLEVAISAARHLGFDEETLVKRCHEKRAARGGFTRGYLYKIEN